MFGKISKTLTLLSLRIIVYKYRNVMFSSASRFNLSDMEDNTNCVSVVLPYFAYLRLK